MSEPKRPSFVIELPAGVQKQLTHWRAVQFPPEAGRPATTNNLHLTLAFLGDVNIEE